MRVLVFHSAYGLRPAIHDACRRLVTAGHEATAADYYGGVVTADRDDALALRDRVGMETCFARGLSAADAWRADAIIGFSLGAWVAQKIAVLRGRPLKLILFHGAGEEAAAPAPGLWMQAHVAVGDPFESDEYLKTWQDSFVRAGAQVELHRYPGGGHIFTDPGLADYHQESAEIAWARALAGLAKLAGPKNRSRALR